MEEQIVKFPGRRRGVFLDGSDDARADEQREHRLDGRARVFGKRREEVLGAALGAKLPDQPPRELVDHSHPRVGERRFEDE